MTETTNNARPGSAQKRPRPKQRRRPQSRTPSTPMSESEPPSPNDGTPAQPAASRNKPARPDAETGDAAAPGAPDGRALREAAPEGGTPGEAGDGEPGGSSPGSGRAGARVKHGRAPSVTPDESASSDEAVGEPAALALAEEQAPVEAGPVTEGSGEAGDGGPGGCPPVPGRGGDGEKARLSATASCEESASPDGDTGAPSAPAGRALREAAPADDAGDGGPGGCAPVSGTGGDGDTSTAAAEKARPATRSGQGAEKPARSRPAKSTRRAGRSSGTEPATSRAPKAGEAAAPSPAPNPDRDPFRWARTAWRAVPRPRRRPEREKAGPHKPSRTRRVLARTAGHLNPRHLPRPRIPRWWPAALCVLLGVLAGLAYGLLRPVQYSATSYVAVVPGDKGDPVTALGFAQAYGRIATDTAVLARAQQESGVPAGTLKGSVEAVTSPDAPMIEITGHAAHAAEAADVANAVARSLTEVADDSAKATGVELTAFSGARTPHEPSTPPPALTSAVGGSAGVLVGALVLLVRPRREDRGEPAQSTVPAPADGAPAGREPQQREAAREKEGV